MIIQKPQLLAILGPTASGKTDWAMKLAKKFNGEIISADSRQIYRELDIGTGKEKSKIKEQKSKIKIKNKNLIKYLTDDGVTTWLYDAATIDRPITVVDYQKMFAMVAEDIRQRGKLPILVGGSGLYVKAVLANYQPPTANYQLRRRLEIKPATELYQELQRLDPMASQKIGPANKRRLARAVEVCLTTGRPLSQQPASSAGRQILYDILIIAPDRPRPELYQRIDQRVAKMFAAGWLNEVKKLITKYGANNPVLQQTIGYKEIIDYLQQPEKISTQELLAKICFTTHAYARRQLTWLRHQHTGIQWCENLKEAEETVGKWYNIINIKS